MQNYFIMHNENRVASVRSDGRCRIYSRRLMPYNLYLDDAEDLDTRLNNLSNFLYWCASRILTLDRKYAKEILNSLGKKQAVTDRDRAEIAISYHALSLTDVFWVRQHRESVKFADINLYSHSLSDSFVDVSLRGKNLTAENAELLNPLDAAGDVATQGVAPKAWIRREGRFYLIKDGERRDVEAELLASRILDCFDVDHVRYFAQNYNGLKVSCSEMITSLQRSIVAIEYIDIYAQNNDLDFYKMVIGLDPQGYYSMNIMDYLVGNTDRHWSNWGVWVDNRNNKITGLHPLMDFNKSFSAYDSVDGAICQTAPGKVSQKSAAIEAVRIIGLNQIAEVQEDWFENKDDWQMFNKRLAVLKSAEKK